MEEETPSYTSVISHYGLQASDMQVKCSDEAIQIVAEKMTDWRLDRFLLGKAKVDEIDRDEKTEEEKKLKYLRCWREQRDFMATYELMAQNFVQARNVSLAGLVCKECKSHPRKENEERDSEVSECQVFAATQEETAVDGVSSGSRDLPVSQAETLGATEPRYDKHSKKKPLPPIAEESPTTFTATLTQESGQTHMVPSTHQRLGTRSSEESIVAALEVANKSLDIVEQQSKERQSMKASNDKKDEKIMLLLERNNKAMCQLVNKDAQIKALQKDSHYTRDRLDLEHSECERLKNDLEERRVKISKLEQDIRQHGKERGQVRDKKEKLEEVETNFKQARRELAKEKKMRNEMGEKLTDTEKRIQDLERCVQRVDTEVKETEGEREYYSDIVQWTKVDVEDEDEDEDVIAFKINKLKTKVRVYKTAFIAVLVILMLLVLSRIPFTCALLFGQDDEL